MTLIKDTLPPNFMAIISKFPRASPGDTLYAYAPAIYNPATMTIPAELMAHEAVHIQRQGSDPEEWWGKYLTDDAFRLHEELLAHEAEARHVLDRIGWNRHNRRKVANITGMRLANPLYEYPNLSKKRAIGLIGDLLTMRAHGALQDPKPEVVSTHTAPVHAVTTAE